MERITSSKNPLIAHIRRLQTDRGYREAQGEFVCDGWKLLKEALEWYPALRTVVLTEGADCPPLPETCRVVCVPAGLMQSLSSMRSPQGVLFTCALPEAAPPVLRPGMLLLDRIQDPGNLGTILRTADAFTIPVVMTNSCADAFSEKTVRASMGAVLRTPPLSLPLEQVLAQCAEKKLPIAATALTQTAQELTQLNLRDYLVVIGSEGQGICDTLLRASQKQIIIPMQPRCESLNAAVAAAIVLWQMRG